MFDISVFSAYVRLILNLFLLIGTVFSGLLWYFGNLKSLVMKLYGFEDEKELQKYSILALCFGIIIGVYWMLRTTKYSVFNELVGVKYIPKAKLGTFFFAAIAVFAYNLIVDRVRRYKTFTVVCVFYALLFLSVGIALKLDLPVISNPFFAWIPGRALGWIYYWAIETLGGILIGGVFWGFVASTTKTESAERGYPFVIFGGQIGNFVGPAFNAGYSTIVGNENLILLMALVLLLVPIVMEYYMKVVPARLHESDDSAYFIDRKKTGLFEGLRLLMTKPYLMGIAIISTIYEVIGTITDFQFQVLCNSAFSGNQLTAFTSFYAMVSAVVALAFSIGGMSFLLRNLGVRFSLLGYPLSLFIVVICLWHHSSLWAFFAGMIVIKAFSYALNSPVKELLYLPTSKDAKMKTKGFVEGVASKGAKGVGSLVTNSLRDNVATLMNIGSIISLGILSFWVIVALFLGKKYDDLRKNKEIVD